MKQRESKRSWASEEGEKLGLEEGAQQVLEGPHKVRVRVRFRVRVRVRVRRSLRV